MERFVRLIVGGGIALIAGLWLATLSAWGSAGSIGGIGIAAAGAVALAAGIGSQIEW